jgi:hypothetical protein
MDGRSVVGYSNILYQLQRLCDFELQETLIASGKIIAVKDARANGSSIVLSSPWRKVVNQGKPNYN